MNLPKLSAAVLCLTLCARSSFGADSSGPPDTVLFNGKVFTADARYPHVQGIAIRGDRIIATGESASIRALSGPQTRLVDLGGHTVIPGINDAHQHLSVTPPGLIELQLKSRYPPWPEVREAIQAAARIDGPRQPIVGTIGPTVLQDNEARRIALDQLAPDRPVILGTFSTYGFILNSAALRLFGIREDEPDPLGGSYDRLLDGRLNGVARGYAAMAILRKEASLTPTDEAVRQLRKTLSENARFGITTLQDMADEIPAERVLELLSRVPTPIRVRIMRMPLTNPTERDLREGRSLPVSPAPLIRVSGTKWKLDGNPFDGPREERVIPGDPPLWALSLAFPSQELRSMLRQSLQYDDQLVVHVSGTPAARAMLEAMQNTEGPQVWRSRRVRFEHGDGVLPSFLPQLKAFGVIVVQNPAHLNLGGLRTHYQLDSSQPLRSLLAAGIPVALGSDGPLNPYLNIALACTHPDRPSEALTREQAVIAYTRTSAYSESMEKEKGSLEAGKLADLAVLSQDIFTVSPEQLPKTASILTMVGGAIVYDAHVLPAN
jgi:predicted amidohydrolase YtcJ